MSVRRMSDAYPIHFWPTNSGRLIASFKAPFLLKNVSEDDRDFMARAQRDFEIIVSFSKKLVRKRLAEVIRQYGENTAQPQRVEACAEMIERKLQVFTTGGVAFAVGDVEISNPVCLEEALLQCVREECVGNLPVNYRNGELQFNSNTHAECRSKRQRPKEQLKQLRRLSLDNRVLPANFKQPEPESEPLVQIVPN